MITTEIRVAITCDADLKKLRLTESNRCHGTTGSYDSQAKALDAAKSEEFKGHRDGKHHLCKPCAELNPAAVVS